MPRFAPFLAALGAIAALGGCVVAPLEPAVGYPAPVMVQPAPVVVHPAPRPWGWRDSDRDGVPNRYDRRPRNPYRY